MRTGVAPLVAIGVLGFCATTAAKPVDLKAKLGVNVDRRVISGLIEVCNKGGMDGHGDSQVALFWHSESAPGCGATADETWRTWELGAKVCDTYDQVQRDVAAGTYTAWAMADVQCVLTEDEEENNFAHQVYYVGPNLRLRSPEVTVAGDEATFRVRVCNNNSSEPAKLSEVALWQSAALAPGCGATGQTHSWRVDKLALGECRRLSHTVTGVTGGTHTAYFVADPQCALAESREDDNIKEFTYSVGTPALADLQVGALSTTVDGVVVDFAFQVCNGGESAAANIRVGLYYDRSTEPQCTNTPNHETTVTLLAAGACQALSASQANASSGSKQAWVLVDSDCSVAESDERNNTRSYGYSVAQPLPDLRATALTAQVDQSQVTYGLEVCNAGAGTDRPFTLGLAYSGAATPGCSDDLDWTTTIPGLGEGACVTQTHQRTGAPAGTYRAHAVADADCLLAEVAEDNNSAVASYEVVVRRPDFVVTKLSAQPSAANVRYTATVCNDGTEAAGALVGLFFDRLDEPRCADKADLTRDVTNLQPGSCVNVLWVRSDVPTGDYVAYALADAACDRVEADEGNNTASGSYRVGSAVADGGAGGDAAADAGVSDSAASPDSRGSIGDSGGAAEDAGSTSRSKGGCSMSPTGVGAAPIWLLGLLLSIFRRRSGQPG